MDNPPEPMQPGSPLNPENAEQLHSAQSQTQKARLVRVGKTDSRYWLPRIHRPVNSQGKASPHYAMQVQHLGRRLTFGLRTSNKEAAARRAARIYEDLGSLGVEGTLGKHRARKQEEPAESVCTIGEYLRAARGVSAVQARTFADYATHLRQIAHDIITARETGKIRVRQRSSTREVIEGTPLSVLTPLALQAWRLAFVARARGDAKRERSARISCNSIIRQARSLFAPKIVKFLGPLQLPQPLPFAGVEFFPRESMRYVSRIDAGALLRKAQAMLAEPDPASFLVVLLALVCGLRRGEIDHLLWSNVDLAGGRIIVDASEHGRLKTAESHDAVDIDQHMVEILRGYHARALGRFVIEESVAGSSRRRPKYRCGAVFERVTWWLRKHGVKENKPLHTLRKESGSIIVSAHGIYAASRHLRHRDIAITAAHYADKKARVAIDTASLLKADASKAGNIVAMPAQHALRRAKGA
jgi:integrase